MTLQKRTPILTQLSVILFTLTVLSCNEVLIPNQRWYGDKTPNGAVYFETQTTATGQLTQDDWDAYRKIHAMACGDVENYAQLKTAQDELCHDSGECVYSNDPTTQNFFEQVHAFQRN